MTSSAELLRAMQWWILQMAADELSGNAVGLPPPPPLDDADAQTLTMWLRHCAEHAALGVRR